MNSSKQPTHLPAAAVSRSKPSCFLAAVLSLLGPGFGHFYLGHFMRGLVLFLSLLAFAPLVFVFAMLNPATPLLLVLAVLTMGTVFVQLFAIVDAVNIARRQPVMTRTALPVLFYGLLIIVGLAYPIGSSLWIRSAVLQMYVNVQSSMEPTLLDGDRLLVNKLATRVNSSPDRGDLVAFRSPTNRAQVHVKRIVALEGDRISWHGGRLSVNDTELSLDPIPTAKLPSVLNEPRSGFVEENAGNRYAVFLGPAEKQPESLIIPAGCCYVLGDHRSNSFDSRSYGALPLTNLIGRVDYLAWPAVDWGRFGRL